MTEKSKPVKNRKKPIKAIKQKNAAIKEKAKETAKKGEVGGFFDFLKAQNVAGLAIGLAVGTAATDTVRKFVQGFVDPIVQLLIGSQETLQQSGWEISLFGRTADFQWGSFLSSLITLLATAAVIYAFLRITGFYKPGDSEDKKGK